MKEETKLLEKLVKCAYVIIALLAINTLILFISNIDSNNNTTSSKSSNNTTENTDSEETADYDVSMFKEVTMDEVIDLFDSEDTKLIYIGRATCGYCVKFLPTLQQAQADYGYQTYYYDMDKLTSEDHEKILKKDNDEKFLEKNFTATPMVILVKDGKLKDTWVGYSEYDDFAQFLDKNEFSK